MRQTTKTTRSRRFAGVRNAALATGLLGCLFLGTSSAVADDADGPLPEWPEYPGLTFDIDYLMAPHSVGRTEVAAAKQWMRMPVMFSAVQNGPAVTRSDASCRRADFAGRSSYSNYAPTVNFISKPGAPRPFGYLGPFTVRTAAFGSIPVEASVYVVQARNKHDQPISMRGGQQVEVFCPGRGPNASASQRENALTNTAIAGKVRVQVNSLKVDGVDLRLSKTCRTGLFDLNLTSPDVYSLDPKLTPRTSPFVSPQESGQTDAEYVMTNPYFKVTFGGRLTADVDVPAFTDCGTASGDDISPLLTATVSGPGTSDVRSEALQGKVNPGDCELTYTCGPGRLPDIDLPARP